MEKENHVNVKYTVENILYLEKINLPDIAEKREKKDGKFLNKGGIWRKEREKEKAKNMKLHRNMERNYGEIWKK